MMCCARCKFGLGTFSFSLRALTFVLLLPTLLLLLQERLEMMNHDLLAEVFHREIVKQEEAQRRKKLSEQHDTELQQLQEDMKALKLAHDNEKIRIRWEHADEVGRGEGRGAIGAFFCFSTSEFFLVSACHAVDLDRYYVHLFSWFRKRQTEQCRIRLSSFSSPFSLSSTDLIHHSPSTPLPFRTNTPTVPVAPGEKHQLARVEAEAGDGAGLREELQEERRL